MKATIIKPVLNLKTFSIVIPDIFYLKSKLETSNINSKYIKKFVRFISASTKAQNRVFLKQKSFLSNNHMSQGH